MMRNQRIIVIFCIKFKGGSIMPKTIVGIFNSHDDAESAAKMVKDAGLKTSDISIVVKQSDDAQDWESTGKNATGVTTNPNATMTKGGVNDNISDGVITGGVLGGLAGLLIGAGTMVIPGLGIIAAAGPITGLLSGAVTGGVVGGLVDLGIPEKRSKEYEGNIREGKVLWSMRTDDQYVDDVKSILKDTGAIKVDAY